MNIKNERLGDIATYINGYAFKPEQWDTTGRPIIRIQNLNNDSAEYNYYNGDIDDKYVINRGDILISWSASIGVYEWKKEEALLNQHIFKVKFDKMDINKRYFKYIIGASLQRATQFMHGSTMKHITKKYFDDIVIPMPSLTVQEQIASVLDKAQELIDKRKVQIEALDELVKSKFMDMFGNLYTNDKKWEEKQISNYCKVKGGKRVPKGERLLDEPTDHPYLRVLDLKNSTVLEGDIKYLSDEIYEKIKRYTISSNDVYLTNVGEKLGMAGTIPEKFNNANLTENAVKLVFDNKIINKVYLAYYLNSEVCQKYILERKMIVGVPKLAIFRIETLPLILPPMELQNQFADFVKQVDKMKLKMEKSLKELEDNFNSLMQRAFKGELF